MTRRIATAGVALLVAACAGAPVARDLDGVVHAPLAPPPGVVHVLVFTSHECPIANAYAPTLRELAARWPADAVRWFLVHVDPDLDAAAARAHARAYELPGTLLLDPTHALARAVGAQRTPEAVVVTGNGVAYRGRIDDQWHALGARTAAPRTFDLADAIADARAGRPSPRPFPPAVGCLLPEPRQP